ncbi:MAG: glycoside hydrolase family 15 protein [Desulfomonilaceae bacterium]
MSTNSYPPIADYGFIADSHSCALVSRSASIDWCCMPRMDSASCFGRILDWENGGYCQIVPREKYRATRRYLDSTLILETVFSTEKGEARVIDCFTMRVGGEHDPHQQILRVIEGIEGAVELKLDIEPRFDYGAVKPWIRMDKRGHFLAIGGSHGLVISGNVDIGMKHRHNLEGTFTAEKGARAHLSILFRQPEDIDEGLVEVSDPEELDGRLEETIAWWHAWCDKGRFRDRYAHQTKRSAMVLKGLTNAPTGAIAAAATTSLPEWPAGCRNWDYRFSWIRDSCFTVNSLAQLGYIKEANGVRRFIERSAAGSADQIQTVFGLGGERWLPENEIAVLEGYRGAKPVRAGNEASSQRQLDAYGELLDLAYRWHNQGESPDDDYWEFLVELVCAAAESWKRPDRSIWELRGEPRHFVYSKVMCWAAIDRGIKLAEDIGREAPLDLWKKSRDEVRLAVETRGYDSSRGVFVQAFDHTVTDASLLLLPTVDFVDFKDERMIRTTDAVREELEEGGLLRRYASFDDGLPGSEGVFLPCSFWLAECLARQGRLDEAHNVFCRALGTGNDLGLFSEEYDTESDEMLGNFPQALTHLSLISAAVALAEME